MVILIVPDSQRNTLDLLTNTIQSTSLRPATSAQCLGDLLVGKLALKRWTMVTGWTDEKRLPMIRGRTSGGSVAKTAFIDVRLFPGTGIGISSFDIVSHLYRISRLLHL